MIDKSSVKTIIKSGDDNFKPNLPSEVLIFYTTQYWDGKRLSESKEWKSLKISKKLNKALVESGNVLLNGDKKRELIVLKEELHENRIIFRVIYAEGALPKKCIEETKPKEVANDLLPTSLEYFK